MERARPIPVSTEPQPWISAPHVTVRLGEPLSPVDDPRGASVKKRCSLSALAWRGCLLQAVSREHSLWRSCSCGDQPLTWLLQLLTRSQGCAGLGGLAAF